jgi:hypothetical protein
MGRLVDAGGEPEPNRNGLDVRIGIDIRDIDLLPLMVSRRSSTARKVPDQQALSGSELPHSYAYLIAERNCLVMPPIGNPSNAPGCPTAQHIRRDVLTTAHGRQDTSRDYNRTSAPAPQARNSVSLLVRPATETSFYAADRRRSTP